MSRGLNVGKKRRKAYRDQLKAAQLVRTDRFTDMMRAVTGGGSGPCVCCTLSRPLATLDKTGVCTGCRKTLGRLRVEAPEPDAPQTGFEALAVYVDASYADGWAGLAVCGCLGEHTKAVEAVSSTHAEVLALRWAFEIARCGDRRDLTFRTDCQAAWLDMRETADAYRWRVEQIPRQRNKRADWLAGEARVNALTLPIAVPTPGGEQ